MDLPVDDRGGQPLLVEADANQLQQALVNLALNARDAILTRQGDGARDKEAIVLPAVRSVLLAGEEPASRSMCRRVITWWWRSRTAVSA